MYVENTDWGKAGVLNSNQNVLTEKPKLDIAQS